MADEDVTNESNSIKRAEQQAIFFERQQLHRIVNQVDALLRQGESDLESGLGQINATNVQSVPGAQYAGVTLVESDGEISTIAATHPYPNWMDLIQREVGEGPCLSTEWRHHTIHIPDLTTDERWPLYRDAALHRTPVRAVLSFQLFHEAKRLAALTFYAEEARAFDEESVEVGLLFAAHTTVAWNALDRARQFRSAIANRDIIGQAKGMLMERFKMDATAAFELLRSMSQQTNTKLVEIADKVTKLDHPSRRR
jgi:hypothetical protein